MALAPAPTLGSPGIDQFSPAQLLRTARLFASDPALPSLVDPDEEESRWVELDSSPHLQIWLLSWPAGTHNEWHDHGESVGAFQVVRGTLLEQTSRRHRVGWPGGIAPPGSHRSRREGLPSPGSCHLDPQNETLQAHWAKSLGY